MELKEMISRAKVAIEAIEGYSQEQIDNVVKTMAKVIFENAEVLSKEAVEETKFGDVEGKIRKHKAIMLGHWGYLKDKKSVGAIEYDPENDVTIYAKPMGVIGCIMPVTGPTVTLAGNALCVVKCRNAMIVAPHPSAKNVSKKCTELLRDAIGKIGAPKDLIQVIEDPTIEKTQEMMAMVDAVVATGGPNMVKAAYSSGKPSFGVGPGNVQTIIDKGCPERYQDFASGTITNRMYDNGVPCTGEQCMHLPEGEVDAILNVFVQNGAYLVKDQNKVDFIRKELFIEANGALRPNLKYVGQNAMSLAKLFGLEVPEGTKALIVPAKGNASVELFCKEKMCPIMAYLPYKEFEEAVENARTNLFKEGAGHTACLFSNDQAHIDYFARKVPVSRALINVSALMAAGNSFLIGLNPTVSLGCGTWGGNSISGNLNYQHLMNKTFVASLIKDGKVPTPEEIWG